MKNTLASSWPECLSVRVSCQESTICKLAWWRISSFLVVTFGTTHLLYLGRKFYVLFSLTSLLSYQIKILQWYSLNPLLFLCIFFFFICTYLKPINFHLSLEVHASATIILRWISFCIHTSERRHCIFNSVSKWPHPFLFFELLRSKAPASQGEFIPHFRPNLKAHVLGRWLWESVDKPHEARLVHFLSFFFLLVDLELTT